MVEVRHELHSMRVELKNALRGGNQQNMGGDVIAMSKTCFLTS